MNMISEKNNIIWAVIIFFVFIAVLFYFTSGKRIQERGLVQSVSPSPFTHPFQAPVQNNAVKVEENSGIHSSVRYKHGSFSPVSITVTNETGCFVEIQNESDEDVVPRLGPYNPKQEKGFLYASIKPHKISLIDPRYGNITQFSFYNKNNPSAIFSVSIDSTCF